MKRIFVIIFFTALAISCTRVYQSVAEYPILSNDIIDNSLVTYSKSATHDKTGSLLINATGATQRIHLYKIKNEENFENSMLIYKIFAKSQDFKGEAYVEMLCNINGAEYFSRGLDNKITETSDWRNYKTPFIFKKGESPNQIALNIVIKGKGKIWIDKAELLKRKLKKNMERI